jgi:hypothetical protein
MQPQTTGQFYAQNSGQIPQYPGQGAQYPMATPQYPYFMHPSNGTPQNNGTVLSSLVYSQNRPPPYPHQ